MFTSKKSLKKSLCFDEVTRLRTFVLKKIGVCVSEQSLFRRFAPYKSDQQHHENINFSEEYHVNNAYGTNYVLPADISTEG